MLGNGSNDVLELVARCFLGNGTSAVMSQHAFVVYHLATQVAGAARLEAPAKDYGHDLPAMANAVRDDTRVIWIANPNNPTGTFVPAPEVEAFLRRVPRAGHRGAGRGIQRVSAGRGAGRHRALAGAVPQPGHHAHLFQSLRPGGRASGFRARLIPKWQT